MKKSIPLIMILMLFAANAFFAAPTISNSGGYILRYINGKLIEGIDEINESSVNIGNNFNAKVKFTLTQSRSISDSFAMNCNSLIFAQLSMANLYFNELYIEYDGQNVNFLAGKYYTDWGTSPLFNVVNLIEPYNFSDLFAVSPVRESVTGFQATYWYQNGNSLEIDFIPIFAPDILQAFPLKSVSFVPAVPSNIQLGVRYSMFVGNYNLYFDLYHGFDHEYSIEFLNGTPTLYNAQLNAGGVEFSGPFPFNQNYNFYGEGLVTYQNSKVNFDGSIGINGYVFNQNMGIEIERGLPGQNLNEPENAVSIYDKKTFSSSLEFSGMASIGFTDNMQTGYAINGYFKYTPIQNFSINIGGSLYCGKDAYYSSNSKNSELYMLGTVYF
ncbi:MAG: hypothetical protein ACP5G8_08550 [Athalassotoga sp.]